MSSRLPQLFIIPAAITFGCGTWQLQRMKWKQDLIERREKMLALPRISIRNAKDLEAFIQTAPEWEYRVVELNGKWDNVHEMLVGMRSQPKAESAKRNAHNETGYHLITPLTLEDGKVVVVNRGWIPKSKRFPQDRLETVPEGPVTINAVTKHDESSGPSTLSRSDNLWLAIHVPAMVDHENLSVAFRNDVYFEQLAGATNTGIPSSRDIKSYSTFSVNPEGHALYAFTWYSLSIAALVMGYFAKRPGALTAGAKQASEATRTWGR